jgi:hypothetical protein
MGIYVLHRRVVDIEDGSVRFQETDQDVRVREHRLEAAFVPTQFLFAFYPFCYIVLKSDMVRHIPILVVDRCDRDSIPEHLTVRSIVPQLDSYWLVCIDGLPHSLDRGFARL